MLKKGVFLTLFLVVSLLLTPLVALAAPLAQEGTLSPDLLAAVQRGAALVAGGRGAPSAVALPVDGPVDEPIEEPVVEPVLSPEDVVIGRVVEFTSGPVSVLLPGNWTTEEPYEGTIKFADEATNFKGQVVDSGDQFPGMLLFPIVANNAEMFVQSFGPNAGVVEISRGTTEDGLPLLRLVFAGAEDDEGDIIDGAAYFIITGSSAFAVLGGASPELWPAYLPALDAVAQSLLVDEERVDLQVAGSDGLVIDDAQRRFSITVPEGWSATPIEDDLMGLAIADPDIAIVGAMMASDTEPSDDELQMLTELIAGATNTDEVVDILDDIVGALELGGGDSITVDKEWTATFPSPEGALGTIRLVGEVEIEEGPLLPLTFYLSIFPTNVTALVFFGEVDSVLGRETEILAILDSMVLGG